MIDVHCHIDQYKDPLALAQDCERSGIITIGMTNLPSHFEMGIDHLNSFKKVRLALGMHPLYASYHAEEFPKFLANLPRTSYIGEVGLDFSRDGIGTKDLQIDSLKKMLSLLSGSGKLVSLHSRKAEKELLELLSFYQIKHAVFHWYTGPIPLIDDIVKAGYYFSINPAMLKSKSGMEIIRRIPIERILTESDGPFVDVDSRQVLPSDVHLVLNYLSKGKNTSVQDIESTVLNNFKRILSSMQIN